MEDKEKIVEIINRVLSDKDINLVRWEIKGGGGYSIIRVFIDKPGGINVSDCEHVSRDLSDLLDIENIIDHRYTLEVSSSGISTSDADKDLKKVK